MQTRSKDEAYNLLIFAINKITDQKLQILCQSVVDNPKFQNGYGAKSHHHNYPSGLLIHTTEVVFNCLQYQSVNAGLDMDVLLTAAIWHDYCKIFDYVLDEKEEIKYTPYKHKIYHISGSAMEFHHASTSIGLDSITQIEIEHCILSHHGRAEYGSPITPRTPEALTLHYADCMSAWFENGKYKEYE